jgi:putative Mn2+ efflux pump MntP
VFEGEKTTIFWIGLIIFGLSLVSLFTSVWYPFAFYNIYPPYYGYYGYTWKYIAPWIFGSLVFLYIGWYMMKSGTKKKEEGKTQLLNH